MQISLSIWKLHFVRNSPVLLCWESGVIKNLQLQPIFKHSFIPRAAKNFILSRFYLSSPLKSAEVLPTSAAQYNARSQPTTNCLLSPPQKSKVLLSLAAPSVADRTNTGAHVLISLSPKPTATLLTAACSPHQEVVQKVSS